MEQINPQPQLQSSPISTSDWMVTTFIAAIPIVGFIMLFVWGFSDSTHPSKANWAKATLLWMLIGIALAAFFVFVLGVGAAMFS